jgi:hypothetical protein
MPKFQHGNPTKISSTKHQIFEEKPQKNPIENASSNPRRINLQPNLIEKNIQENSSINPQIIISKWSIKLIHQNTNMQKYG